MSLAYVTATVQQNISRLVDYKSDGSQTAASEQSGIPQRTIGRIVNGENVPSLEFIVRIAEAYGYEAWQLVAPGFNPESPQTICKRKS